MLCPSFCVTAIYVFCYIYQVQTSDNDASSSNYSGGVEVMGSTFSSFPGQFVGIHVNNGSNLLEDEQLSSACQEKTMLWLNDYTCSLCGIELPPSFVEERLEHSDFHLAEKLQKEESSIHLRTSVLSQRYDIILYSFHLYAMLLTIATW